METHNKSNKENFTEILEIEIREVMMTRYNEVTGTIEFSNNGKTYHPITDRDEKSLVRYLKTKGYKTSVGAIRNILNSDFSPKYNPFEDYFSTLPEWDKETDYIAEFCKLADVENSEFWVPWVKKWMVAVIACSIDNEISNHQVLVLVGGQGLGKTTFLQKLIPAKLKGYANTGYLNPENKDSQIQLSENLLMIMDELAALNARTLESFKQIITQNCFKVRRPYGTNAEILIKRASFCGSTNEKLFLIDSTGNRRFLPFTVNKIDLQKLSKFDIDLAYAQAFALYIDGFQYWFDQEDNKLIAKNNLEYQDISIEEDAISEHFTPGKETDSAMCFKWTATQVMDHLSKVAHIPNTQANTQKVGKAMVKMGFHRHKSNGKMVYLLKIKGFGPQE